MPLIFSRRFKKNEELPSCDDFNTFFSTLGEKLSTKIEHQDIDYATIRQLENTMVLTETTESEVYKIISNLKTKHSTDYYSFSNKFLKIVNPVVTPTLTKLLNRMIFEKTVPSSMKVSKVIPLFKNGTRQDPTNYRPIAITPIFSKVLEKILETRILKFFDKYNVLNTNQYGFRAKRKTVDAILELTEYVHKQWGRKT